MKRSIYCCYAFIEPHHPLLFNFFFLIAFFLPILKKKKKKRPLLSSQLVHIYCYTSSNISPPSLSLYLPTTLYFTVILPSTFSLSYILTFLFPIIFCINSISFLSFNSYFSHEKNCEYSLSLTLSVDFYSFL